MLFRSDPTHGADRTEVRRGSGTLGDDFPFVAILLFSEEDADIGDVSDHTFVIQDGGLVALVGAVVQGEPDVAKFKTLGVQGGGFTRGVRAKELTRAHQEEEAYDGGVVDVCVDGAFRGVVEIKVGVQGVDEAETDGVGTGWRLIGSMHALAELVENAMRLSRVWVDSGIREAQLGDALGHGGEGSRNGSSSERLFGGLGLQGFRSSKDPVAGSAGKEHLGSGVDGDIVESAGQLVSLAPVCPMVKGLGAVPVCLFRACSISNSESKAAPIVDTMAGRRWTS